MTLKADTFVYNANAFRTPEGSVVEELVKRDKTNLDLKWLKEQSDDDAHVSLKELLADMEKYRDTINKAVTQLAALAKGIEE